MFSPKLGKREVFRPVSLDKVLAWPANEQTPREEGGLAYRSAWAHRAVPGGSIGKVAGDNWPKHPQCPKLSETEASQIQLVYLLVIQRKMTFR